MKPEEILAQTRKLIQGHAAGNLDDWWYANRFVFARLMLDERKSKTDIKKRLLDAIATCHFCGNGFTNTKGIHLHRLDQERGYSDSNCVLAHPECHQQEHRRSEKTPRPGRPRKVNVTNPATSKAATSPPRKDADTPSPRRGRRRKTRPDAEGVLLRHSQPYSGAFHYWWDIPPALAACLGEYESVEFVRKDSGLSCLVSVNDLLPFLTPDRQSSRASGNWGIRVRRNRENELAFEPPAARGQWLYLPVVWLDNQAEG